MGTHPIFESDFDCLTENMGKNRAEYVAIDCEMVATVENINALARVSVVNENCNVLLDEFVVPESRIRDYRTRYSGITPQILKERGKDFGDIKDRLKNLTRDKVIVGHTINYDLESMGLTTNKPIVDISMLSEVKALYEEKMEIKVEGRVGLKRLTLVLLSRLIQDSKSGNCSVEDSIATMEIFQLVKKAWEKRNPDLAGDNLLSDRYWNDSEDDLY